MLGASIANAFAHSHGLLRDAHHADDAPWVIIAAFATLALVALFFRVYHASPPGTNDSPKLALAREKDGARMFSFWTRLAFYFDCSSLYHDVWQFSKNGLPVLVPTLGTRSEIFLPHSSMKWAMSQPARVLGMWDAFQEMFQLGHSLGDEKYMIDTWPHMLARRVLTQELDDHLMSIHDELAVAIDTHLGTDTENWTALNLLDTVRLVIGQTGSRFTVGSSLCRNQEFLRTIIATIDSIIANAGATGFFPECIRTFAGKLICFPTALRLRNLATYYAPLFQERIAMLDADAPDQPVDLLQKMLRFARKHRPEELAVYQFTRRMCMANLAFVYLASFTTTNILLNIMASDAEHGTIATLRAEAEAFLKEIPDPKELWTRRNTVRMTNTDSVMRESLRIDTVPTRSIVRKVMVDGVVTDAGLPLPKGSLVSFVSQPMHTDPDRWDDPLRFDPFRFVKLREEEAKSDEKVEHIGGDWSRHSFLSTADLLVFGRGKNSCPGRLLMEIQLKMLLSYLLRNYDIKFPDEYEGKRPGNKWVLEFFLPSAGAKFQVKRRKSTTVEI